MVHQKLPSLKDKIVRALIYNPTTSHTKRCRWPQTCQYCTRISQLGTITKLHNHIKYNTNIQANCQSSNLIYWLECNICNTKYGEQTRNRIIFQGHLFDIEHSANTTLGRHFVSHNMISDPEFIIHVLECIQFPKCTSIKFNLNHYGNSLDSQAKHFKP